MPKHITACLSRRIPISRLQLLGVALIAQGCAVVQPSRQVTASHPSTTIVVVRHAEKSTDDPRDPTLSALGQDRARALAAVLKDAQVGAIYVTHYRRTRQTADPLALQIGVPITERTITDANTVTYATNLAREVLAGNSGKTVLIVGHSNTVPQIVEAFSGSTIAPMTDAEYDRMFVITVSQRGPPVLVRSRFGRPTP